MGLPKVAVGRPVLIWVVFGGIMMLGLISVFMLPVELYQGASRGIISIIIRARGGLPPIAVEQMITKVVEESVSTVSNLKSMYSNSREAESRVTLEFGLETDMKFAALEVREKFSRIRSDLPEEIEKPVIANYQEADAAILILAVTSEIFNPEEIRELVEQDLKPRLDRVDGVASVDLFGGRERKILVELDRDKMYGYGISVERVMDSIGASNIQLLAGSYEVGSYDFAVRTMGAFTSIEEIGELGVKVTRQGSIIPLSEVATVKDAFLEPENYARLNLDSNVSIQIKKTALANTIKVVDGLKKVVNTFTLKDGSDLTIVEVSNKADLIKRAIGDVRNALIIGAFLVTGVIYFSFRRWIYSAIVFSTIPLSVVSTFFMMQRLGLSINVMTLSGLALSIGILVDSAVETASRIALDEPVCLSSGYFY